MKLLTPLETKIERIKLSISQKAFAALIGKSKNAYHRWENGKSQSYEIAVKATEYIHTSSGGSYETGKSQ